MRCISNVVLGVFLIVPAVAVRSAVADAWTQPAAGSVSTPVWGIDGGLTVGLSPTPGPRGLIRIYTPYLNQKPGRIMQFIAVEPVVGNIRGLSEMEPSRTDGKRGKQMWTADDIDAAHPPGFTARPARGAVSADGHTLSFFVIVEPFDNGARPVVKITFHRDHPHEVSLQTFAAAGSASMQSCVLTATMGNYARLRRLQLQGSVVDAADLFQKAPLDHWQFYPWHSWPADALTSRGGEVIVSADSDAEPNPPATVPPGWRYQGLRARQTWTTATRPGVTAAVNGRSTFWASDAAIPGGPAFENFELRSPFVSGQTFCFGVEPIPAK